MRIVPAAKSICTMRPRKKSNPRRPSSGRSQEELKVSRFTASDGPGNGKPEAVSGGGFIEYPGKVVSTPRTWIRRPGFKPNRSAAVVLRTLTAAPLSSRRFSGSRAWGTVACNQIRPSRYSMGISTEAATSAVLTRRAAARDVKSQHGRTGDAWQSSCQLRGAVFPG